jgi:hypothetical protein
LFVAAFADAALGVLGAYLRQVILILGPLAVLGAALFFVIRRTQRLLNTTFGWKAVVYTTGWLGTPIHELSHALVGKLFGIKIVEVKLFDPDPKTGVLGYVNYQAPQRRLGELPQWVGTFFMGIAPLLAGTAVILGAFVLLVQPEVDGRYQRAFLELSAQVGGGDWPAATQSLGYFVHAVFGEIFAPGWSTQWQRWVFLYVTIAVGGHLAPSHADLRGAWPGFLTLLALGLLANVTALLAGADPTAATRAATRALSPLGCLLLLTLVLNTGVLACAELLAFALGRRRA